MTDHAKPAMRRLLPLAAAMWLAPVTVLAQDTDATGDDDNARVIEEVVVHAQRREENLREVPVSIEAFDGFDIRRQGFRDLDQLANFSTTVLILPRVQDQDVSIRGLGTTGNALTLDQAAPMFVDGIHFGRSSQTRMAFMDLESVEVLKGPQPLHFGQNATAGAFNIRSRRPSDTWQADADLEIGNNETYAFDGGVGGPLGERFGIRLAGKYDDTDGFLEDIVSGRMLGAVENVGGRVILQFEASERTEITFKAETSKMERDGETSYLCRTDGPLIFGRDGPTDNPGVPPGDERSVWEDPPTGSGWSVPHVPLDTACFTSDKGVSNGGPYFLPPDYIREENSDFGSLDIRAAAEAFTRGDRNKTTRGYEDIDADNGYLEVAHDFASGANLLWLSGWNDYNRDYALDNSNSPFLMNLQARGEEFEQLSSELRITSSGEGDVHWMIGAYWQQTELFAWSSSLRANVRQMQRYNEITEDVDSKNIFGSVTFDFWDDRMSLDVGWRYEDVGKHTTAVAYGAEWVYTVEPVSAGVLGEDYFELTGDALANARLLLPTDPGSRYWYMPFRGSRDIPVEWLPSNAQAIGLTAPDYDAERLGGPWDERFDDDAWSPQVTLRYRHDENHNFYARYAESFKIGGFDTGQTSIPRDIEDFRFESEDVYSWEIGSRSLFLDGRLSLNATIFYVEFDNLQTTALSPDPDQNTASVNAGQRVQGLEFDTTWAAGEHWLLGLSGAFMDGIMTDFRNAGCTQAELYDPNSGCVWIDPDDPSEGGLIDRTGERAPRTPEWKFVLTADYQTPVFDNFVFLFNAKGYISDGYIIDVESFDQIVKFNQHEDLNLTIGLGDAAGRWSVSAYARSLLEARPSYNAQYDVIPNGLAGSGDDTGVHLSPSSFTTYGLKFTYRMR